MGIKKDKPKEMKALVDEIKREIKEWPEDLRVRLTGELAKRSYAATERRDKSEEGGGAGRN